ncbi:MAG: tetratricopeptide repeat protein [Saprospiraceae bacterium]|nr:tetratricopeptide repeat protein [Saprospiraceae bacterium]
MSKKKQLSTNKSKPLQHKDTVVDSVTNSDFAANNYAALSKWAPWFMLLLGIMLYINTLNHGFVLDDYSAIEKNWVVQSGVKGIPTILTTEYRYGFWNVKGELYRPLSLVMFAVEWEISPDNPMIHHLVSILLYGLLGFYLYRLLARLFKNEHPLLAFFSTLLFMAHPIHTEVVANIKSRDEVMAMLFSIFAINQLLNYVETKHIKWMIGAVIMYALAMFSKENMITYLAVFPLILYFFTNETYSSIFKKSIWFVIPAAVYLFIRWRVLGDLKGGEGGVVLTNFLEGATSYAQHLASAIMLLGLYLWKLILPHPLSHDYGYNQIPLVTWSDWKAILSLLIHVAIVIYALRGLKKKEITSFGILFYVITFSLYSNILMLIGSSFGERFLFISTLGYTIVIASLILKYLGNIDAKGKINPVVYIAIVPIFLFYVIKTIDRNRDWVDGFTLYKADLKTSPNCAMLNYHMGLEYVDKWEDATEQSAKMAYLDSAKYQFERAIEIFPQYHGAYGDLGLNYFRRGNEAEALKNYELSLKYNDKSASVYSNMGIIYFSKGDYVNSIRVYQKAIELDPRFVDAHRNLGSTYAVLKRFPEALKEFKEGLKYLPDDPTLLFYTGSVYKDMGDSISAKPFLERAYQLDPKLKK